MNTETKTLLIAFAGAAAGVATDISLYTHTSLSIPQMIGTGIVTSSLLLKFSDLFKSPQV